MIEELTTYACSIKTDRNQISGAKARRFDFFIFTQDWTFSVGMLEPDERPFRRAATV